jgi:hypothetical protein
MNPSALGEGVGGKPCLLHGHTVATLQKYLGLHPSNASESSGASTKQRRKAQRKKQDPGVYCLISLP